MEEDTDMNKWAPTSVDSTESDTQHMLSTPATLPPASGNTTSVNTRTAGADVFISSDNQQQSSTVTNMSELQEYSCDETNSLSHDIEAQVLQNISTADPSEEIMSLVSFEYDGEDGMESERKSRTLLEDYEDQESSVITQSSAGTRCNQTESRNGMTVQVTEYVSRPDSCQDLSLSRQLHALTCGHVADFEGSIQNVSSSSPRLAPVEGQSSSTNIEVYIPVPNASDLPYGEGESVEMYNTVLNRIDDSGVCSKSMLATDGCLHTDESDAVLAVDKTDSCDRGSVKPQECQLCDQVLDHLTEESGRGAVNNNLSASKNQADTKNTDIYNSCDDSSSNKLQGSKAGLSNSKSIVENMTDSQEQKGDQLASTDTLAGRKGKDSTGSHISKLSFVLPVRDVQVSQIKHLTDTSETDNSVTVCSSSNNSSAHQLSDIDLDEPLRLSPIENLTSSLLKQKSKSPPVLTVVLQRCNVSPQSTVTVPEKSAKEGINFGNKDKNLACASTSQVFKRKVGRPKGSKSQAKDLCMKAVTVTSPNELAAMKKAGLEKRYPGPTVKQHDRRLKNKISSDGAEESDGKKKAGSPRSQESSVKKMKIASNERTVTHSGNRTRVETKPVYNFKRKYVRKSDTCANNTSGKTRHNISVENSGNALYKRKYERKSDTFTQNVKRKYERREGMLESSVTKRKRKSVRKTSGQTVGTRKYERKTDSAASANSKKGDDASGKAMNKGANNLKRPYSVKSKLSSSQGKNDLSHRFDMRKTSMHKTVKRLLTRKRVLKKQLGTNISKSKSKTQVQKRTKLRHVLRSLDTGRSLRSQDNNVRSSLSDKNGQQTSAHGSSLHKQKAADKKIKQARPPPESPPHNPTLPVVEVDRDAEPDCDLDMFFPDRNLESKPRPLCSTRRRKGRRARRKLVMLETTPQVKPEELPKVMKSSPVNKQVVMKPCDLNHSCCQKNATSTTDQSTQWEDPSEWYAAIDRTFNPSSWSGVNFGQIILNQNSVGVLGQQLQQTQQYQGQQLQQTQQYQGQQLQQQLPQQYQQIPYMQVIQNIHNTHAVQNIPADSSEEKFTNVRNVVPVAIVPSVESGAGNCDMLGMNISAGASTVARLHVSTTQTSAPTYLSVPGSTRVSFGPHSMGHNLIQQPVQKKELGRRVVPSQGFRPGNFFLMNESVVSRTVVQESTDADKLPQQTEIIEIDDPSGDSPHSPVYVYID